MSDLNHQNSPSQRHNNHQESTDPAPRLPVVRASASIPLVEQAFESFRERAAIPQAGAQEFFQAFDEALAHEELHPAVALWSGALLGHAEKGREYLELCLDSSADSAAFIAAFSLGMLGEDAKGAAASLAQVTRDQNRSEFLRVLSRWALERVLPPSDPAAPLAATTTATFQSITGDMGSAFRLHAGEVPGEDEIQEAVAAVVVSMLVTGNHLFQPFEEILQIESQGLAETRALLSQSLVPDGDDAVRLSTLAAGVSSHNRLHQLASGYALESLGAGVLPIQKELVAALKDARESGDLVMERPLIYSLSRLGKHALEYPETLELMKKSESPHGRVFGTILIGSLDEAGREHLPFLLRQINSNNPVERSAALAPIGTSTRGSEFAERQALEALLESEVLYDENPGVRGRALLLAANLAETTGLRGEQVVQAAEQALQLDHDDAVEGGVIALGRLSELAAKSLPVLLEILAEDGRHTIRALALQTVSDLCFAHEIEFEALPEVSALLYSEENPKVIEDVIRALYREGDEGFDEPEWDP